MSIVMTVVSSKYSNTAVENVPNEQFVSKTSFHKCHSH